MNWEMNGENEPRLSSWLVFRDVLARPTPAVGLGTSVEEEYMDGWKKTNHNIHRGSFS